MVLTSRPCFPFFIVFAVWVPLMLVTVLVTYTLPESYCGTALIRVGGNKADQIGSIASESSLRNEHYSFHTECQVLQSEILLGKVIDALELEAEWGKRYGIDGQRLKPSLTLGLLLGRLDVCPVRNTNLIAIRVFGEKRDEPAQIANAIAESYRKHWLENHPKSAVSTVEIVDTAIPALKPVRPNKVLNISLGILAGAAGGCFLATFVYVLRCWAFRRNSVVQKTQFPTPFRTTIHVFVAIVFGGIVGYHLAMPISLGRLISTLIVPLLWSLVSLSASAYTELANPIPLPPPARRLD